MATTPKRLPPGRCNEIIKRARKIASGELMNFSRAAVSQISKTLEEIDDLDRRSFTRKQGIKFHNGDPGKYYVAHDDMVRRLFGAVVGVESPGPVQATPTVQPATEAQATSVAKRVTDSEKLGRLNRDLKASWAKSRSKS